MKLSAKLFLFVVVTFLGCLVLVVYLTGRNTTQMLMTVKTKQQSLLAQKTLQQIDQFLYERYYDLDLISHSIEAITTFGLHGQKRNQSEELVWLGEVGVKRGAWEQMCLVDLEGMIVQSTLAGDVAKNIRDQAVDYEFYKLAIKEGIVYSDWVIDSVTGKPTLIMAAPVLSKADDNNQPEGVLIRHVAWPLVEEMLAATKTGAYLINTAGVVVASNQINGQKTRVGEILRLPQLTQNYTIGNRLDGGKGRGLITVDRESGYLNYKGNGWSLVFESLISEINKDISTQIIKMLIIILPVFGVAMAGLMGVLFSVVIRRIEQLHRMSLALAQGDFSIRVKVKGADEIGKLGQAFNRVASELGLSHAQMQQKVTKQTQALAEQLVKVEEQNEELAKVNKLMINREIRMVELKHKLDQMEKRP